MAKRGKQQRKRIKNLILICGLMAVVLTVSTYAWFIGMQTVNVSSFDVEIASTDSLLLSLNGENWSSEVKISKDTVSDVSYENHTNNWGGTGLIPLSTIGEMDEGTSRMKLYEKASLTTTTGGYRLMASQVKNEGAAEANGYVVFDLFVKNFSGTQYLANLNVDDEEAIYLTTDSRVTVASDGVANTGIENSVRVAFTQVGRVAGTTDNVDVITGISCATASSVTGICRDAQIWEPNDKDHESNAIKWYEESCIARKDTGTDVTLAASFSGSCGEVVDGETYKTYAVSTPIGSNDNVDVYDGADYNTYTHSSKLVAYDYFTDSKKILTGMERPTFMTLAPNSITKLRIYVYIEGQDVDNYDFASIGKKISVNFGFTKERFIESDIQYEGPTLRYAVTFDTDGGTPAPATQTVVRDIKATLPLVVPQKEGYTFSHWALTGSTDPFDFDTPITEAKSLIAIYTENE